MNQPVKHPSPPLPLLAGVHLALFMAGLAVSTALAGGAVFPSPFDPVHAAGYFAAHASAVEVASFFLFGSAVPLGLFAATASSRLAFFGVRVAGVNIAAFGGYGAALMLLLSGSCMWALGQPGVGALPEAVRVLHLLAFATGGPGFAVTFGLLVLGVSLAGGLTRHLPRWLMGSGLAIGVIAELSSLSLLSQSAAVLLPLTRFPGLIWLVSVAVCLPAAREREPVLEREPARAEG
ncbi:MAG TPA: hypothetical protein VMG12_21010 [Polyangiaceae bacterium]|nr:hypothetical protein [Polyangiaceae bacterium]